MRTITILGSTGIVGRQTIELLQRDPQGWKIHALVAGSNTAELAAQVRLMNPTKIVLNNTEHVEDLKDCLVGCDWKGEILAGPEAIVSVASEKVDIVLGAIVGMAGVRSAYAAVQAGNNLAIANKESIVAAGNFLLAEAAKSGSLIIPVDSEHSSLFQLLKSREGQVRKLILTASGGPFFNYEAVQLQHVTLSEALRHPNWRMGIKNTIDSATMVNKGLEVIEATRLFGVPIEQIDVVIHRESIVHALIELVDGSMLAHLSVPDMKLAISTALYYPNLLPSAITRLDLAKMQTLTFYKPRDDVFPALKLARLALNIGGAMPLIYNIVNEVAVEAFVSQRLSFIGISKLIEEIMTTTPHYVINRLDDIFDIEQEIRTIAAATINLIEA